MMANVRRLTQMEIRRLIIDQHSASDHYALTAVETFHNPYFTSLIEPELYGTTLKRPGRHLDQHRSRVVVHEDRRLRYEYLWSLRQQQRDGCEHVRFELRFGIRERDPDAVPSCVGSQHRIHELHLAMQGFAGIGGERHVCGQAFGNLPKV